MTNEQVRDGFNEVYNDFWNRYKDRQPEKDSPEWERICSRAAVLKKKYPFLAKTIAEMVTEFDQRMRGKGRKNETIHSSGTRQV